MSAIPAATTPVASPWRMALPAFVGLWLALLWMFRDTATAMVGIWWRSETFAHAFLVLPISLWLVWRRRRQLAARVPRPEPWLLVPMLAVAAVWLLAELVVVNAAGQFAFVALLVLAVPAVLGRQVALAILFPLMFLFFGVPFGEFMLPPMMEWTADFVVVALRLTGVPVFREGLQFVIPSGNWSVVTECSGVRYLIASFMVGSLFAYLNYRSNLRRAVFMAFSIAVPIVANWLRAYIIVMMGHLSGNKLAVGVDHILYGWVFFGVVIFIMFSVGARWAEDDLPAAAAADAPAPAVDVTPRSLAMAWLGAALVAASPHLALWGLQRAEQSGAEPTLALPAALEGGWAADADPLVDWTPAFGNPSTQVRQTYAGAPGKVGVYVGYYRGQGSERKLVSSVNDVVAINDRVWNRVGSGSRDVPGAAVTLRTSEILGPTAPGSTRRPQLITWHAYWIDGRFVASDARAKIAGALARLRGRGDDGAVLILFANHDTPQASAAALEDFARANLEPLNRLLQRARDTR